MVGFGSERISPTALYTCETWARHGRSFPELSLPVGTVFYNSMQLAMMSSKWLGGPTLQDFLLARHDLIDAHLTAQIEKHGIRYVVEIASGFSPRGMRFVKRYSNAIHYLEADLPGVQVIKRERLDKHLKDNPQHKLFSVDVLAEQCQNGLQGVFERIPEGEPVCVISEGLLNYFSLAQVEVLIQALAKQFKSRAGSSYVSDIHLKCQNQGFVAEAFKNLLSIFVRGQVHLHYQDAKELQQAFLSLGMDTVLVKPSEHQDEFESCAAKWADLVSILIARHKSE